VGTCEQIHLRVEDRIHQRRRDRVAGVLPADLADVPHDRGALRQQRAVLNLQRGQLVERQLALGFHLLEELPIVHRDPHVFQWHAGEGARKADRFALARNIEVKQLQLPPGRALATNDVRRGGEEGGRADAGHEEPPLFGRQQLRGLLLQFLHGRCCKRLPETQQPTRRSVKI